MERTPVRYVVLRDRRVWEDGLGVAGLQAETDGVLTLARVPGAPGRPPTIRSSDYGVAATGLAVGSQGDIYIATDDHAVIWMIGACRENRYTVNAATGSAPDGFHFPRGLTIVGDALYVADSGHARVLVFHLPSLEQRAVWQGTLQEPTCLGVDSRDRIYVLDRGLNRVLRFDAAGAADASYNQAMSQHGNLLKQPAGLAIGGEDVVFVSDQQTNGLVSFNVDGRLGGSLPSSGAPTWPRALAARAGRLYAADASSGWIHVFQKGQGWLGRLSDYRGPVSAMTLDADGRLYIKPGLDDAYDVLDADAAYVPRGLLTGGPFDAGDLSEWERVSVDIDLPAGTAAELRLFTAPPSASTPEQPALQPSDADWSNETTLAPSLDTLVFLPSAPGATARATGRYLWLRIVLTSTDLHVSPRLRQIQAATTGASYLDHLPAVYAREDARSGFLERWLALFRAELGDWDLALDDMARRFDSATSPESAIPWLARWLAFKLPHAKDAEEWRLLLADVHRLYERRGTPFGLREFCELYTGVRPVMFEAFRGRHAWQLGEPSSRLGFGTALAPALPDGMIVPGFTYADPGYMGLRGDYYGGTDFDRLKATQTDATVEFDSQFGSRLPELIEGDYFSVRWTGQVLPRYTELYTFRTVSHGGVRLWLDGRLLIDDWHDHGRIENSGQITLTAGRWYAITLEYFDLASTWSVQLFWASRSQRDEVIPQDRLYAIVDASATSSDGTPAGRSLLVGQAVVGNSGPLATAEFGMPLFSDTAHLFTVVVPGAQLPTVAQRDLLKQIVDEEKPVHTDFHLCFAEARMRVGFQARIGIDAIVAGTPGPMALDETSLGRDSVLGGDDQSSGHSLSNDRLESHRTRW